MEFVAVETAEEKTVRIAADGQALVGLLAPQM
ncbi:hypothetical protein ABIF65_005945 [Bradyrhizobium japonicum]|jgi:hypothetical protein|nr:hypothetical protein [Bradyrhizobium japonicum]MCP1761976.1 hypothetical protein [Bradyrhizobium japonicum]MCP1782562.1 hypothetical protein [Bradyrhizobium japonicum]MCP1793556.1 hypothetical protein [Bradyrhizobium japonicum]MCP1805989.1 hypothetical protein [Bradyrhizobium japonicum]